MHPDIPRRTALKVLLLRLLPPLVIFLASLEVYVRYFVYDAIYRDNDCITYSDYIKEPRAPHRFFRPNCRVNVESVDGTTFEIATNEDGLRDRPRGEFAKGAIALLGDSHAEGFAFDIENSVGRRLEALAGDRIGGKVLNLGFRGTGPGEQLRILDWVHPHYKILGVIWILTENDILDEFYFRNIGEGGWLKDLSQAIRSVSAGVFGRHYFTLEWLRVVTHSMAMIRATRASYDSETASREFCKTVVSVRKRLPDGAPVTVVAIPHGAVGENLPYFGAQLDHEAFWRALDCVANSGIRVIDHRAFFSSLSSHYIPDRYHLDRKGTDLWAHRILADLNTPL